MLAPVIPLMYLDSVVDGMLKGLNEQLSYLSYNIIDSVMRVGLILFLLPLMGLNGLIVVIFASEILNSTLSIARLMKVTQLKMRFFTWILKPALAVVFPGLLLMGLSSILSKLLPDVLFRVLFELIFTVGIYLLLLFAMKMPDKRRHPLVEINFPANEAMKQASPARFPACFSVNRHAGLRIWESLAF